MAQARRPVPGTAPDLRIGPIATSCAGSCSGWSSSRYWTGWHRGQRPGTTAAAGLLERDFGTPKRIARRRSHRCPPVASWHPQVVVAVAAEELPLVAKVVVELGHAEIGVLRQRDIGFEAQNVGSVAAAQTASAFVGQRHVLVPHLLHHRVDTNCPRVAQPIGTGGTLGRLVSDAVKRNRRRVQVVRDATKRQQDQAASRPKEQHAQWSRSWGSGSLRSWQRCKSCRPESSSK